MELRSVLGGTVLLVDNAEVKVWNLVVVILVDPVAREETT